MKISVVIATFNTAKTLHRTLASIDAQVARNIEVVISDGGSTDGIEAVCARFPRLDIAFKSEPDKGIYDALNKGVRRATGDIVYFLGGDDAVFDPLVFARITALFAQNPRLDLAYGDCLFVGGGDSKRRSHAYLTRRNFVCHSLNHQAVFARRQLFESIGEFDLRYALAADFDWLAKVFKSDATISYIPLIVSRYATDGFSAKNWARIASEMAQVRAHHAGRLALLAGKIWGRLTIAPRLVDSAYPLNDETSNEELSALFAVSSTHERSDDRAA